LGENALKKIIKKTNTILKIVNNLSIKSNQIFRTRHSMSKEWEDAMATLAPIYKSLEDDFFAVDLVDLIFYERWLNERH